MSKQSIWLANFADALPCGCVLLDGAGRVVAVNPIAREWLALHDLPQVLSHPVLQVVTGWNNTPLAAALEQWPARRQLEGSTTFEVAAPNERWLAVSLGILPDPQDEAERALIMLLQDASEVQRLQRRLKWSEYQASIGKLARGIAHELNNPLDGVLRYTHLALQQLTEDSPVREHLTHVQEGLDRMVRAVRAFLEFSRQAVAPVNRVANLNQLIEDALLLVKHRAKFQNIRILKQLDIQMPVVVDGGIQHAIVNLIKNAFDAMPRGGTLTITTRQQNGSAEIEMQDTGSGIPEDIRERVFEPFFSTKPIHQGSGLGLIIAKEVVERSGGTIDFTSQAGIGTTFLIRVPTAPPDGNGHAS